MDPGGERLFNLPGRLRNFVKHSDAGHVSFGNFVWKCELKSGPRALVELAVKVAMRGVTEIRNLSLIFNGSTSENATVVAVLNDCVNFLGRSHEQLNISLTQIAHLNMQSQTGQIKDIQTWTSAAITYYTTCIDGLDTIQEKTWSGIHRSRVRVEELLSIALSFVNSLLPSVISRSGVGDRNLLSSGSFISTGKVLAGKIVEQSTESAIPDWLSAQARRILQAPRYQTYDAVVAHDGSGQFRTIQDAVNAAPWNLNTRYIIYIQRGVYRGSVIVQSYKTNLMFVGDGMGQTIITGSKNVLQPGVTMPDSATVGIDGKGFLARDLTIRNTAGPIAQQAVALRVSADQVAFWRCSFEGFQDTLYSHVFRHFFRDCAIAGTVDFIFGNSAAVFQNCAVRTRPLLPGQQAVITAQGRTDPGQTTGFSFHNCVVGGAVRTYLGRPWKEFSRTVFLRSTMSGSIAAEGWLRWEGTSQGIGEVFYGEYLSSGRGAITPGQGWGRVPWAIQITRPEVAEQFTVQNFISGAEWLPGTSITFDGQL
ncbi:hypothetical protein O6H91_10G011900 [Diphasiastrum complanatum]|uniref:Uncharacterized protein n=1 Tax=Diphasiastrum complanatum TaxID=34168 RepID=A0ACC2CEJ5_DIPCM|nr:hypothetical protein O6H91_10G011900 [Diphasiastrum complanatum]